MMDRDKYLGLDHSYRRIANLYTHLGQKYYKKISTDGYQPQLHIDKIIRQIKHVKKVIEKQQNESRMY